MTPKEKAIEIIKEYLTILQGSSTDYFILLGYAKKCALASVNSILKVRPGYPYPDDVGLHGQGIFNIIHYPVTYWREVRDEIAKYEPKMYKIETDPGRITCFTCGKTSYNVNDVNNKYCGHCQKFHEEKEII